MEYIWNQVSLSDTERQQRDALQKALGISVVLCNLLVQRGITSIEEARKFFRPQLEDLYSPYLMNDMDKAVQRLNQAFGNREKILIYGDYDVDGVTAVALVYKFLSRYHADVGYYIPDRDAEGYGISYKGVDYAETNGFTLVIALDCGTKDIDKVDYAQKKGIDIIICDHHTPDSTLPSAVAVLNPKREDSTYPYSHLSGCGVGFKFMQAFAESNGLNFSELLPLLELLAISIASDIVPVTGENRTLSYYGLKRLNSNPDLGLKGLITLCGLDDKEITMMDVAYKMGPRINASGRIDSGREAVELLVTNNFDTARKQSYSINEYNLTRQKLDKGITEEANEMLSKNENFPNERAIVLYNEKWHKGVIGIVASRLVELYYKPSIVLAVSDGIARGSARSVEGFDLYKAIDSCHDLLTNFGGHTYAAGLSLKEENLKEFEKRFKDYVSQHITPQQLTPSIEVNVEIGFSDITPQFFQMLKQFGPFGSGNENPIFLTRKVFDYGGSRLVGKSMDHLKLELMDSTSKSVMNGIAFSMGKFYQHLKMQKPIDILYTLEENTFNGNTTIQLMIKDIKPSEEY